MSTSVFFFLGSVFWSRRPTKDYFTRIKCWQLAIPENLIKEKSSDVPIGKADWPPRFARSREGRAIARAAVSEINLAVGKRRTARETVKSNLI